MWKKVTRKTEFQMHAHSNNNPEMMRRFFDENQIQKFTRLQIYQDWNRFFLTKRDTYMLKDAAKTGMPYNDHGRAFMNHLAQICYVSQPYAEVRQVKVELEQWASERGLVVELFDSTHSWYNKDNTMVVLVHLPGVHFIIP